MRSVFPALLLALAIASPVAAADVEVSDAAPVPTVVADVTDEPAQTAPMHLEDIQVEERNAVAEADAAQWPARGSFWWLVGVIVVAGVILAVVLD